MTIPAPTAYWNADEASGVLVDATGNQIDMTDVNTVGAGTGLVAATARDFERDNDEWFSLAALDAGDFHVHGHEHFYCCGWVKHETVGVNIIMACYQGAGTRLFQVDFRTALTLFIRNTADTANASVAWGSGASTGTWYFWEAWHDPDADQIGVCIDRGTDVTAALSTGMHATAAPIFSIGESGVNSNHDGLLGPLGFWNHAALGGAAMPTAARDELYNAGAGVLYPFAAAARPALVGGKLVGAGLLTRGLVR